MLAGPSSALFIHQAAGIAVRTDTAAARSASDIGTRPGSSIVTRRVRALRPPRSPFAPAGTPTGGQLLVGRGTTVGRYAR